MTINASDGISVDELVGFLNLFTRFGATFNTGEGTVDDLALRLAGEIESGGRTAQDVFDSLLRQVFESTGLSSAAPGGDTALTKTADDAGRIAGDLVSGERTTDALLKSLTSVIEQRRELGDVRVIDPATGLPVGGGENVTIPGGAKLVKITDPTGSDSAVRYAVTYNAFGVEFSFTIGDLGDFDELFPGGFELFDSVETITQAAFNARGFVEGGSLDAAGLIGQSERFQSLLELEMAQAGLGDLPAWMRDSPEAMAIVATGAVSGWDPGRTWVELAKTEAFSTRFVAFDSFGVGGETVQATIERYLSEEERLVAALTRHRPSGFEITTDYLGEVLARGWRGDQVDAVLASADVMFQNPGALANLNLILRAQGLPVTDELGLLQIMSGDAPEDVIEAVNTAAAQQALTEAGFDGVSVESLIDIIDEGVTIFTPDSFREIARNLSLIAAENFAELDRSKFGLTREDLVATFFGEESPTGRSSGEILETLSKFERERRAAAQGFGGTQGFANREGNLVLQGLGGF